MEGTVVVVGIEGSMSNDSDEGRNSGSRVDWIEGVETTGSLEFRVNCSREHRQLVNKGLI